MWVHFIFPEEYIEQLALVSEDLTEFPDTVRNELKISYGQVLSGILVYIMEDPSQKLIFPSEPSVRA